MGVQLAQNANGQFSRIWLELPVFANDWRAIYDSLENVSGFVVQPLSDFHLTVLHLGKPGELWTEMSPWVPQLSRDTFIERLQMLLGLWKKQDWPSLDGDLELLITGYELLNAEAPMRAVVATCLLPQGVLDARAVIWADFERFLTSCGVMDLAGFVAASKNLRYAPPAVYRPHVTLGHLPAARSLPMNMPTNLRLQAGPLTFRGVVDR